MSNPFSAPAPPGSGIEYEPLLGALLLVEPHSVETGIKTSFGEKDAVRADVTVLDGEQKGEVYADTLVFPTVLIGQLRSKVGEKVLGRLTQGQAKPGQKPPWMLEAASDADQQIGVNYLAHREKTSLSQPATAAAGSDVPF